MRKRAVFSVTTRWLGARKKARLAEGAEPPRRELSSSLIISDHSRALVLARSVARAGGWEGGEGMGASHLRDVLQLVRREADRVERTQVEAAHHVEGLRRVHNQQHELALGKRGRSGGGVVGERRRNGGVEERVKWAHVARKRGQRGAAGEGLGQDATRLDCQCDLL